MLTKQQMSVARKVYGRCYCRRCATSGKIAGGSERFVKGVYAGIFCSECWALDERSGNTPNGSVLLNGGTDRRSRATSSGDTEPGGHSPRSQRHGSGTER